LVDSVETRLLINRKHNNNCLFNDVKMATLLSWGLRSNRFSYFESNSFALP